MTKNRIPYLTVTVIMWIFMAIMIFSHSRYNSTTKNLINDLERTSQLLLLKTKEEVPDWQNEQIDMGFERIEILKDEKRAYGTKTILFLFGFVVCYIIQEKLKKTGSNKSVVTTPAAPRPTS